MNSDTVQPPNQNINSDSDQDQNTDGGVTSINPSAAPSGRQSGELPLPPSPEIQQQAHEKNIETTEETISPEALSSPETEPPAAPSEGENTGNVVEEGQTPPPQNEKATKIIDRRNEADQLHAIDTSDELTKRADEEEDKFIKKVEEIHKSN